MNTKQKIELLNQYKNCLLILKNEQNKNEKTHDRKKVKVLTKKFYGRDLIVG